MNRFFGNLHIDHLTLDLDSTVMTRYGQQESAARGYNPHTNRGVQFSPSVDGFGCRYTHNSQSLVASWQQP